MTSLTNLIPCDYTYNGKEKVGHLLDYGARYFDAAIGRFTDVDPLASDYPSWTPYHYVHKNPLIFIDPSWKSGRSDWLPESNEDVSVSYVSENDV